MAVVYEATHRQQNRRVAIKVLPPQRALHQALRERFVREARAAAALDHPGIVPVYSAAVTGDIAWFVMALVQGESLARRLTRLGQLPTDEARWILAEIADALDYAHRSGLVHRDVKPDNILFDEDGNALITDFGIATARFHQRLTMTGRAMGTPHYMSPEQAMGKMVDGRSDIYAAGVLLYEMLVGFPPFDGADSYSIGYKHVHEDAASPDIVDSRTPPALAAITMKCLAKAPTDRFQRGNDLSDALIAYLSQTAGGDALRNAWLSRRLGITPTAK